MSSASAGCDRPLRMLFFLDYIDTTTGVRFKNSPGLLPLIGHTRRRGFTVDFIATEEDLLRAVADEEVDVVGISSMERLLPRSIPLARKLRELRPDLPLMMGGNAIDAFAVDLVAGLLDVVVLGEAEHSLPALLDALAGAFDRQRESRPRADLDLPGHHRVVGEADPGGALSPTAVEALIAARFFRPASDGRLAAIGLGNVLVRDGARGVVWRLESPDAEASPGVDVSPVPRDEELPGLCQIPWDLVEQEGWNNLELYAQRGCRWGQCHFCSVGDRNIRCLSPDRVVEVIAEAVEHGIEVVSFSDNLFVQYQAWNRAVLEGVIERRIPVTFRAQTMANRTVWPLLDLMREAGFTELAFGLETLLPGRAEFMGKSYHGTGYLRQARETIERTAAAGIYPVLYLIMADPRSTLLEIAAELEVTVTFVRDVYRRTGIVPKPSYSPVMLPVADTRLTAGHACLDRVLSLGRRSISLPENFRFTADVADYLNRIGRATDEMVWKRENLAAFPVYFQAVLGAARNHRSDDLLGVEDHVKGGRQALAELFAELDEDIDETARAFDHRLADGVDEISPAEIDFRRFGPYIDGVRRFSELLAASFERRNAPCSKVA